MHRASGALWAQQKFPVEPVRLITSTTPTEHEKNLRADIELFAKIIKETALKAQ